jgi:hypothetical protein
MTDSARTVDDLLDQLIEHWRFWEQYESFYLETLAPSLAAKPAAGDAVEQGILSELLGHLGYDRFSHLPELIRERRIVVEEAKLRAKREVAEAFGREQEALALLEQQIASDFLSVDQFLKTDYYKLAPPTVAARVRSSPSPKSGVRSPKTPRTTTPEP